MNKSRVGGGHGYDLSIIASVGWKYIDAFSVDSPFLHFASLVNPEGGGGDGRVLSIKAKVGAGDRHKLSLHFSCHFFSSLLFLLSIQTDKEMNVGHERTLHFY